MKFKMNLAGKEVEAETVGFSPIDEHWSTYKIDDGSIVRLKLVVSDVFRLPTKDPITGAPQYIVRSSNIVSVEPATPQKEVH